MLISREIGIMLLKVEIKKKDVEFCLNYFGLFGEIVRSEWLVVALLAGSLQPCLSNKVIQ